MTRTRPRVVPSSRPRRRRSRTWLRFAAGFGVSVLVGACGAAGLVHWGSAQIDRTMVAGLTSAVAAADPVAATQARPELLNVLVVGNDSRDGLTAEQIRQFGTGDFEGTRTDTVMLLQLELNGQGRGAVLSFPRDLLVTRCDGTRGRINAAYGIGVARDGDGPSCLVETVADLTGVKINHYVEVSFAGFLEVVDAIGGVGLYLDEPLSDQKAHIDLPAGCVQLRGRDALGFVRARQLDNDFGRIARQQRFLKETVREATELGVVTNPARLVRLVDAATGALSTDDTLGPERMRAIATGMRSLTAEGLSVHTVPSDASLTGGSWYVVEQRREARALYRKFRDGSIVRTAPKPSERPTVPAKPAVTVLNAGQETAAADAAARLVEAAGFAVSDVADAQLAGLERTRILHPPQLAEAAAELAKFFPGAEIVEGVDTLPLTVKVGDDADAEQLARRAGKLDPESRGGDAQKPRAAPSEPAYRGARMTDVDC